MPPSFIELNYKEVLRYLEFSKDSELSDYIVLSQGEQKSRQKFGKGMRSEEG